jgi:imidazolonepropionase
MKKPTLFRNIGLILTLKGVSERDGRHIREQDLGFIHNAALVVSDGKIQWIGEEKKLPKAYSQVKRRINLDKQTVLPGFVECHTHSVFSGSRAAEFELRNQGMSYQEIAARGGGILHTMKSTRASRASEMLRTTQSRVDRFVEQGVTTLEIKSGYALDLENEVKILQVVKKLKPIRVVSTYLGAHALPPEFKSAEDYLKFSVEKVLPILKQKKLTERVDIFAEKGFFIGESAKKYLQQAKNMGFAITIHADQLSLSGGSDLAVELAALSADHVLQIGDAQVQRFAESQTTCVLLPAADLYLRCAYPPARKLLDAGARVALATDFNPGSSPTQDLSLVGLLARLEMKMSLPEVIAAYTYNAAAALNLHQKVGSLEIGKCADFISTSKDWNDLFYSAGEIMTKNVYFSGHQIG